MDWVTVQDGDQRALIAVDGAKLNLSWLAFPEVDSEGIDALPDLYVESIHAHMTKDVRAALATLPLNFIRYWSNLHNKGIPMLTEHMPEDYMARMILQAHKAQARMVVHEGNIVRVEFGRKVA